MIGIGGTTASKDRVREAQSIGDERNRLLISHRLQSRRERLVAFHPSGDTLLNTELDVLRDAVMNPKQDVAGKDWIVNPRISQGGEAKEGLPTRGFAAPKPREDHAYDHRDEGLQRWLRSRSGVRGFRRHSCAASPLHTTVPEVNADARQKHIVHHSAARTSQSNSAVKPKPSL